MEIVTEQTEENSPKNIQTERSKRKATIKAQNNKKMGSAKVKVAGLLLMQFNN
jgi:hypothetical protein